MWIKFGEVLRQISDKQWKAYLSNTLLKSQDTADNSKIKKALGYTWYLDDEKK